jgi:hypothetical protein
VKKRIEAVEGKFGRVRREGIVGGGLDRTEARAKKQDAELIGISTRRNQKRDG